MLTMPGGSVVRLSNWRRCVFLPGRARAGLSDRFRIHDLRHTAASLMIQAGYPPKMLQEILGHTSITTTLDLYGHLYPGEMDRYAARLDDARSGSSGFPGLADGSSSVPLVRETYVRGPQPDLRWSRRRVKCRCGLDCGSAFKRLAAGGFVAGPDRLRGPLAKAAARRPVDGSCL
jgi:Phage integrase family